MKAEKYLQFIFVPLRKPALFFYKNQMVKPAQEIISVHYKNRVKPRNTVLGQNAKFF
jgi:hypothetical protein